jgi:pyridoxine/pyridoxamine 5'-phosphate oxidase
MSIADLRREYALARLDETSVSPDPLTEFARWFNEALEARVTEPNAMTLATATPDGVPSARIVLLKGFDERGFVFFTDYRSQKGTHLEQNPQAALSSTGPSWSGRCGLPAGRHWWIARNPRPTSAAVLAPAGSARGCLIKAR